MSIVIPTISVPPCPEHEEDDTEDYDDDNNAANINHLFRFQNTFTVGMF